MMTLKALNKRAKEMKKFPTKHEKIAADILKSAGIPFKTQVVFGFYILDFLIANRLLVLEMDGPFHKKDNEHDRVRDNFCKEHGLEVLRVKNENWKTVLKRVMKFPKIESYKGRIKKIRALAAEKQSKQEALHNMRYDNKTGDSPKVPKRKSHTRKVSIRRTCKSGRCKR